MEYAIITGNDNVRRYISNNGGKVGKEFGLYDSNEIIEPNPITKEIEEKYNAIKKHSESSENPLAKHCIATFDELKVLELACQKEKNIPQIISFNSKKLEILNLYLRTKTPNNNLDINLISAKIGNELKYVQEIAGKIKSLNILATNQEKSEEFEKIFSNKTLGEPPVKIDQDALFALCNGNIYPRCLTAINSDINRTISSLDDITLQTLSQSYPYFMLEVADNTNYQKIAKYVNADIETEKVYGSSHLKTALESACFKAAIAMAKMGYTLSTKEKKDARQEEILNSNNFIRRALGLYTNNDQLRMAILAKAPDKGTVEISKKPSPLYLAIETEQYDFAIALIDSGYELKKDEIAFYKIQDKFTNLETKTSKEEKKSIIKAGIEAKKSQGLQK